MTSSPIRFGRYRRMERRRLHSSYSLFSISILRFLIRIVGLVIIVFCVQDQSSRIQTAPTIIQTSPAAFRRFIGFLAAPNHPN